MTFIYSFHFQNHAECEKEQKGKNRQPTRKNVIKTLLHTSRIQQKKNTREPIRREEYPTPYSRYVTEQIIKYKKKILSK